MFMYKYMYYYISLFLFFSSILTFYLGMIFINLDLMIFIDWEILTINSCLISMSFLFDYMSIIFMSCVFMISSMVIFYSSYYMNSDLYKYRFLLLILLFVISMFFMIISPNLISILLGWDGLGLISYCLVIYFQNYNSYNSGMLTILTNRIGDVCILICISWMLNFGGWNYIYYLDIYDSYFYLLVILLTVASFTKSAQIPFSSWLPAAMAAPTPVSALVHSSTLVTAGVYLMIRFSPIMYFYDCFYFMVFSMLTMFMSGLSANFEYDLKKIIALSTLSQLGLMMSILMLGFPMLAFFHLLSHAFFKALLFLCAGLLIHGMNDTQDIRDMGYSMLYFPYTSSCLMISSFSLSGLPFLSGFYSKDMILDIFSMNCNNMINMFIYMFSVMLTVSYSFRLFNYLMFSWSGVYVFHSIFESNIMMYSMIILSMMSIFFGTFLVSTFLKSPFLIMLPVYMKMLPLFMVFMGLLFSKVMSFNKKINNLKVYMFSTFFMSSMWFMPKFSTYFLYSGFMSFSSYYNNVYSSGWGEYMFSKSHMIYFINISSINFLIENNNIKLYMIMYLFIMLMFLL
uniref:NADH-ubiquinone oxidoreductase chain 5 n=1 Tax=Dicyphus sp. TaxID=2931289 RepID=A0A8T9ZYV3_9HEMI|nr:NADH dehydrogenase subunit 5 [Dicyphus sp.]